MEQVSKMVFTLFFVDAEHGYVRDRIEFFGPCVKGDRWKLSAVNGNKLEEIYKFKNCLSKEDTEDLEAKLTSIEKHPDDVLPSISGANGYLDIYYRTECHKSRIGAFTVRGNESVESLIYDVLTKYGCYSKEPNPRIEA